MAASSHEDVGDGQNGFAVDEDAMRNFFPTSFGKQSKSADIAAQIDQSKRTVKKDVEAEKEQKMRDERDEGSKSTNEKSEKSDSDSDSSEDDEDEFPTSHELVLKTHEKPITSVSLDASGSRLITGSNDCTIKLHDFASMTPTTLRAFKSVDPTATKTSANTETHPVYQATLNPLSANHLLVITATPQPRILNRDGDTVTEFVKGDMYLRDMHQTKGHVSELTAGAWHPVDRNLCVTAGTDSTLRVWDVNFKRSQKEVIVHKSKAAGSGGRSRMTAVCWGNPVQGGNHTLVSAAVDGSLLMWSGDGPHSRPAGEIREAHAKGTWTSGIDVSRDGRLVVTRGGDDNIKLWDIRKFKSPITSVSHPSTSSQFPSSNIQYSPSSANIITGSPTGDLHILNPATLKPELVTPVTKGSPLITVVWHERLNQIVTGSANAETHVLYNPEMSSRGAALVMSKAPKRRHIDDDPNLTTDLSQGFSGDSVVNPNGILSAPNQSTTNYAARHPTVGMTASGKSKDPRRPNLPAQTPFAKSQPDERHIKEHIPLSSMRDEDPREALLKYADQAQKDPMFTKAWKDTQPKTLYADLSDEEEGEPDKKRPRQA